MNTKVLPVDSVNDKSKCIPQSGELAGLVIIFPTLSDDEALFYMGALAK